MLREDLLKSSHSKHSYSLFLQLLFTLQFHLVFMKKIICNFSQMLCVCRLDLSRLSPLKVETMGASHLSKNRTLSSGQLLHMSGVLLFMSGTLVFVAATQGAHLDHLALVARRTFVPGSRGTVTVRETVLSSLPPPPRAPEKKLICLSWSFRLRWRLHVAHTSRGLLRCSQGT